MEKVLRVASVQFEHRANDKSYNMEKLRAFARKAAEQDADLVAMPEMCISGYWHITGLNRVELDALSEPLPDGPSANKVRALAIELGIAIGAGLLERSADGELFNSYFVAMPNGDIHVHRKLHSFEHDEMCSGDSYTVFDTPWGVRIGILICYDNNVLENARATALLGADILIAPHQTGGCDSPSPHAMGLIDVNIWRNRETDPEAMQREILGPRGREWLMPWLPSRARDNGIFVVFTNGIGEDAGEIRTGNAMLIDPYGRIVKETSAAHDDMVIADLDLELLPSSQGRRWLKVRRPELYDVFTQPQTGSVSTRQARISDAPEK